MDCYLILRSFSGTGSRFSWLTLVVLATICVLPAAAHGQRQIRTKKPDRGVYQPPTVQVDATESANAPAARRGEQLVEADIRDAQPMPTARVGQQSANGLTTRRSATQSRSSATQSRSNVRSVRFNEPVLDAPYVGGAIANDVILDSDVQYETIPYDGEIVCGAEPVCGVEAMGCDSIGCDSAGSCGSPRCGRCLPSPNGYISFSPDRWFGSIELMLMYRKGDRLPTLLTTGPSTDADTAGELGQAGTQTVVGGDPIFRDVAAGGRLTLGTWLDNQQCRSLIFRGWFSGEKTFGFVRDQNGQSVITRPFLDVSDNQAAQQDTLLIAFPGRATGSISISGDSNVYGGDVSVRQFWYGIEGLSIDFLYGYQFMRLDENLAIRGSSVSLDDDFAPLGSTIAISDSFDIENEFHGGQIGVASMYREGCWSFSALAKTGFGSLARRADLQGETRTSIDGNTAVDNQGLLVRDLNSGSRTDHTFGWVPEIDLTLGWRKFPCYEVTVGYHITAMTDALQVSGAVDPSLAVNLSDPPTGQQRPRESFDYRTFYVQGIHFGLQYVY
ncbi:BBP7 family outer membrane beta-barrel protein [Planctomycetes bacterium K23_9]|uniref:Uncharacterized protein n=1 Tax=Stieleria marina TaxID=1930275 RepID=A0A517NS43_9BACT|nr:hypothetical protein K239x_18780 [Planctomycetes bacterium K23_9]